MSDERSLIDRFDAAVQEMLAGAGPGESDATLAPLLEIAAALRDAPRAEFRAALKAELAGRSPMVPYDVRENVRRAYGLTPRQTATPVLRVRNAAAAIEFYTRAFGAREIMRFVGRGQIAHAELQIGNAMVFLGEAAPEYGFPSPESLGGSPAAIQLDVEDVDAWFERAVGEGAQILSPVADQFYGARTGRLADPFGFTWTISTRTEEMSVDEMSRRFAALEGAQGPAAPPPFKPEGFHTVTPYLVVHDADALIEFLRRTFGAEQTFHAIGSAGGVHAEVRVGDSMLMVGGGGPNLSWRGRTMPTALHVYVEDADATFDRAVGAGATIVQRPADQPYGERLGGVTDAFGNTWFIATAKGPRHVPEGRHTLNVYLHPLRAEPVISFMQRAFGATGIEKFASPDGVIHHAKVTIGDSTVEMGEASGTAQPMPTMFYLYVPDVDAAYRRAVLAGAKSIAEPQDHDYGDRSAGVEDLFGNQWHIATHLRA